MHSIKKSTHGNYNNYIIKLFILLCALVFVNCKSSKSSISSKNNSGSEANKLSVSERNVLSKIDSLQTNYETLMMKGSITYQTKDDKQKYSYKIHLKKDSILWSTVGLFGFEGARLNVSKDSVKYVNRMEKNYLQSDFSPIKDKIGLDITLTQLQQLLTGNLPKFSIFPKISMTADQVQLLYHNNNADATFVLNKNSLRLQQVFSEIKSQTTKATVTHSNYKNVSGQSVPFLTKIEVVTPKETQIITLEHSEIQINPLDLKFQFSIPPDYEEIPKR